LDPRDIQATLAWSSVPAVGERSLLAVMDHARESRRSLAELWEAPVDSLAGIVRLQPRAVAALSTSSGEHWRRAGADAESIRQHGIDLLVPSQPDYPAALRPLTASGRRRPLIFAYGALGLLEEPRVALVNSRSASLSGIAATDAVADALARRDVPLVTSTSRDTYQAAAVAAKRHAAPSVMVLERSLAEALASGIDREPVASARVWDESFDPDLQLLLSPFGWNERWTAGSGPRRDALIFDLADVVVAVDVQSGGNIDRECRRAARAGKRVLALDRGPETSDGSRRLWEEEPNVARVPWSGAEAAAGEALRALPGERPGESGDRALDGWRREVFQFLARACGSLGQGARLPGVVGASPAAGPPAQVAAAWSPRHADATAGLAWLLADLASDGTCPATRPAQLLERVARGGFLAASVPAAWLEAGEFAGARSEWLRGAALRLAARLPGPIAPGGGLASAAVILQRDGAAGPPALVFAPERERMGRFHLRRYLQEVLAALARGQRDL
jgi:predicted Rossmann fold nucleotide-binding protein DprA/Smf involved in DNA uptake